MLGGAALGLGLASCFGVTPYPCQQDSQCRLDGQQGWCEDEGFCSLPDDDCDGGRRFSEHAPGGLSEACVGEGGSGSTDGTSGADTAGTNGSTDGGETVGVCVGEACGCAEQLVVAGSQSCAIRQDGALLCWGDNTVEGRLGFPVEGPEEVQPITAPTVVPFGESLQVTQVALGNHGCASTSVGVRCWGRNNQGQVMPTAGGSAILGPTAPGLAQLGDADSVVVAPGWSCGLLGSGDVTCWGQLGSFGASGDDVIDLDGQAVPSPVQSIVALREAVCVLAGDEQVWCAGNPQMGEMGLAEAVAPTSTFVLAVPSTPGLEGVGAGTLHACAWRGDQALCWGSNANLQNGSAEGPSAHSIEQPVALSFTVDRVSAGQSSSCALGSGTAPWCWGAPIPDGGPPGADRANPTEVSWLPAAVGTIVDIGVGTVHGCALTDTDQVWCWGSNTAGQLGVPGSDLSTPQQVDLGC
ncbi:MAG: hypothetical protein K0V04_33265 [Deltaproteobacteria bacterium]|nr:hypothetical protein [Deltaproteobacteria bacterium]